MKKQILTMVMLLSAIGFAYAQDSGSQSGSGGSGDFAPAAGDISGALIFGRYNFLQSGISVPGAPYYSSSSWSVSGSAPYLNPIDVTNDVTNMVGVEGRYFITNRIAAKLSGGAIIRNTPAVINVPGYIDTNTPVAAWIPAYSAVIYRNRVDANINISGEYHFTTKYSRLFPYVGVTVPIYYARETQYDPTFVDVNPNSNTATPDIVDVGNRHSEIWGFGLQAVGGFDYYLNEGLYFGIEVKPISYVYSGAGHYPAPGLDPLKAETGTWAFFAQPFLKLGFRF